MKIERNHSGEPFVQWVIAIPTKIETIPFQKTAITIATTSFIAGDIAGLSVAGPDGTCVAGCAPGAPTVIPVFRRVAERTVNTIPPAPTRTKTRGMSPNQRSAVNPRCSTASEGSAGFT